MNHRCLSTVLTVLAWGFFQSQARAAEAADASPGETNWQVELLRESGVPVDGPGLIDVLRRLRPTTQVQAEIAEQIRRLGHSAYLVREDATRVLARYGAAAESQLRQASKDKDLEIAVRARRLLQQITMARDEQAFETTLLAALQLLKTRVPAPQAAAVILDTMTLLPRDDHRAAACEALWAQVRAEDAARLRSAVHDGPPVVQAAAIPALEVVLGERAVAELQPFLESDVPTLRLAAARGLIDRLPHDSLRVLVKLLEAKDFDVRLQSAWLLQEATENLSAPPGELDLAAQSAFWTKWNKTADLQDLKLPLGRRRLQVSYHQSIFRETFQVPVASIRDGYRRFRYESDVGGKASVAQGVLRLDGHHPEGDQHLFVTSLRLFGQPQFPDRFQVQTALGGEDENSGGWHVGVAVGNLRFLFHPGYTGGAFRVQRVDNQRYLISNTTMPFTPAADVLHEMTLRVQKRADGTVQFDVVIVNGENRRQQFATRFVANRDDLGALSRIGLQRSGRTGGDAHFGSLTVNLN